jgi:hypothetical protein
MMEYPRHCTCEVVVLRLESYVRYTLAHGDALAIAEHLEACESCTQLLAIRLEQWTSPGDADQSARAPRG